ncbi:MAG: hydrogenase expression/formation protein [Alphaproteobacteria bacterium]
MTSFSKRSPTGPGSQPLEEDSELSYMPMPSGMMTFAMPDLPEPEETGELGTAKALLARVAVLAEKYSEDGSHNMIDLAGLDADNLALINQILGEGEVSIIAGTGCQVQEAVLAGVWRVRVTDENGALLHDLIEVARFPVTISALTFHDAQAALTLPEEYGANIVNAPMLLPEINEHIPLAAPDSEPHVINLSLLPHTEEDLAFLDAQLGRSGIIILSRGYGSCRVTATNTRNVWWVQFYNSQDTLILNSIEITPVPEVVCAAPEDIADSAKRLAEILEVYR